MPSKEKKGRAKAPYSNIYSRGQNLPLVNRQKLCLPVKFELLMLPLGERSMTVSSMSKPGKAC